MASIKGGNGTIGGSYYSQNYYAGNPKLSLEFIENFQESIIATEAKVFNTFKVLHDSIVASEVYVKVGTFLKAFSDSIGLTEAKIFITSKVLSSAIVARDSIDSIIGYARVFIDSIGINEALRKALSKAKLIESIIATDIGSVQKVLLKYFSDSIHAVDSFISDWNRFYSQFFSESITVSESWGRILDKLLSLVDNIHISEVMRRVLPVQFFVDSVDMLDSVVKKSIKSFTEAISFIDTSIKNTIKILTSGIVLTETFGFVKMAIKRFVEVISLADSQTIIRTFVRLFQETIVLTEKLGSIMGRIFIDSIIAIDTGILTPIKNFIENINLSENFVKSVKIVLSSILNIVDSRFVRKINGQVIEWVKGIRKVLEWTGLVKKEDQYIEVVRKLNDWEVEEKDLGSYQSEVKPLDEWTKFRRK